MLLFFFLHPNSVYNVVPDVLTNFSDLFFISLEIVHNLFLVNLSHLSCSIQNLFHFCILCFKITTLQFLRCFLFGCLFFNGFSVWAKLVPSLSRLSRLSQSPSEPTNDVRCPGCKPGPSPRPPAWSWMRGSETSEEVGQGYAIRAEGADRTNSLNALQMESSCWHLYFGVHHVVGSRPLDRLIKICHSALCGRARYFGD